ncbi:MAG TPA: CPBP family intramembrane glutamic endopeptidase [Methylomirabilota bacterium]|nr:CPBP family intramembrane glutamic endopeptidase [Methylomirabilota bacterium]
MSLFENDPAHPEGPTGQGAEPSTPVAEAGATVSFAAPPATAPAAPVPPDLRISWSWAHFVVFLLFGFGSQFVVVILFSAYLGSVRGYSSKQVEHALTTSATFAVAIQLVWFGFLLLFLYVTLSVLRDAPFWSTVGWRSFSGDKSSLRNRLWPYFFSGCGLSAVVAAAGVRIRPKNNVPIEELFKDPHSQLMLMAMAVLVAPLVEETVFRGYLYPFFARKLGVPAGVLLTGTFFGLMHGSQLGWNWGIVGLLIFVGVVFTYVRARTGTVLASYLLHLGYNSLIALAAALATRGFQQPVPTH